MRSLQMVKQWLFSVTVIGHFNNCGRTNLCPAIFILLNEENWTKTFSFYTIKENVCSLI